MPIASSSMNTPIASVVAALGFLTACGSDSPAGLQPFTGPALSAVGHASMTARYMAELWTKGNVAYTSTWGTRFKDGTLSPGNAIHIWRIDREPIELVDSLIIDNATITGDVQVSDDGKLLVVATERENGSIVIFDLTNPFKPVRLTRYQTANTSNGVHTAELARVNGRLYAFLAVDAPNGRLVIVDLTEPSNPREVLVRNMTVHDTFVRDGILFTALVNNGTTIWDLGGGGKGGSPENPVQISNIRTATFSPLVSGSGAHNLFWFHNPAGGANAKRYLFVGEEGPGAATLNSSTGDIHVVDVSDMAAPREVAFFHLDRGGTHNFSVDEQRGILYAAFYEAGVRAIDIRGDLGTCSGEVKAPDGRCDLKKTARELAVGLQTQGGVFVWGVHFDGNFVYASDMIQGIWKLVAINR
jgi:hypothetical protein